MQEFSDEVVDVSVKNAGIDLEVVGQCREGLVERSLRQTCDDVRADFVQAEVLLGLQVQQDHLPVNLAIKHLRRYLEGR